VSQLELALMRRPTSGHQVAKTLAAAHAGRFAGKCGYLQGSGRTNNLYRTSNTPLGRDLTQPDIPGRQLFRLERFKAA